MNLLKALLSGFSEVFFQENIIFGAFIAIGLGIASPYALLIALIGGLSSIATAHFLGVKDTIINSGVYSFNGLLSGLAISFYMKHAPQSIVFAIIGAIVGTLLFHTVFKNHVPPLTAPFVLTTWGILLILRFIK